MGCQLFDFFFWLSFVFVIDGTKQLVKFAVIQLIQNCSLFTRIAVVEPLIKTWDILKLIEITRAAGTLLLRVTLSR